MVKLTGSSTYQYYSAADDFSAASISVGESYFARSEASPSLSDWIDGTTIMGRPRNACVKVFTSDAGVSPDPAPNPDPTPNPNPTPSSSSGGGCDASTLPAMFAALALAFTFTRRK